MKPLRLAVIGAGHLGKIHARLLPQIENVELVAVADPSPLAQKAILETHDVQVISDFTKLIGQIDAAVVATPTRFHYPIALELLTNGIHTLIEKPVTDDEDDARALVHAAQHHDCVLSVGHVEQYNPAISLAAEKAGRPKFIQASRMSGYTYRSIDIGVVYDLMIHDIDLVNTMFPGELVDCRAVGVSVFGGHEDIAQARLQFSCGGVANLTASRMSFSPTREFQVFGSNGFAVADLVSRNVKSVSLPNWVAQREFDFLNANPEQQAFIREQLFNEVLPNVETVADSVNAIQAEQMDWIQAIQSGSELRNTGENAAEAVAIAQRVLQQIESHCWAEFDVTQRGPMVSVPGKPMPMPEALRSGKATKAA